MSATKLPASPDARYFGRLLQGWDRFWFSPGDPTILGLLRIFCGFTVLYIHLAYSYDLQEFFGKDAWISAATMDEFRHEAPTFPPPKGWDNTGLLRPKTPEEEQYIKKWGGNPHQAEYFGQTRWSIWYHVTDPTWMRITHGTILFTMLLFAIGFCTRITGVLAWAGMLSYVHRSPTSLFGMDNIMNVVMLYLVIGPSGAALSVDRLITRYWATYQALRRHKPPPTFGLPAPRISANFALRLLQVHVCIVYLISGTSKLQGGVWWSGYAVWLTMANYEFSPMDSPLYMAVLRLLSEHRWLWELVMTAGTFFTLIFEISFAYLIWNRRLRWPMIICAVLLHLGIALCMGLVTFSMMMLIGVLSFVPSETVRQLLWRLGRGPARVGFAQLEG